MHSLLWDLRLACRRLTSEPLVAIAAAVTLSIGVSAAVVMADLIDRLLLRPPPHVANPERVVRLYHDRGAGAVIPLRIGWTSLQALQREGSDILEVVSAYLLEELSMGRGSQALPVNVVSHTEGYFRVLGARPLLGRLPMPGEADAGRHAVISYGLWQRAFGGADDVLGRRLEIGVHTFDVVAVTQQGFNGVDNTPVDVWLPLSTRGERAIYPGWQDRDDPLLTDVVARVAPGVNTLQAAARIEAVLGAQGAGELPRIVLGDALPSRAPEASSDRRVTLWTGAMSILVLLVACGNAGNLLLVRRMRRAHDTAVKMAMGATRFRLLREAVLDAFLLACLAGIVAVAVTSTGSTLLDEHLLGGLAVDVGRIDLRRIVLATVVSLGAGFLLTFLPALHQIAHAVSPGGAHLRVSRRSTAAHWFVAVQLALTVPLVLAAAAFVLSFRNASGEDFGLVTRDVFVVETNTAEVGRPREAHLVHRAMQERLRLLPGLESVALAQAAPPQASVRFRVQRPGGSALVRHMASFLGVDPEFFDVARLRVVDGRPLAPADNRPGVLPVVVISESLARTLWLGERAVGSCLEVVMATVLCAPVVGVVADMAPEPNLAWRADREASHAVLGPLETWGHTFSRRVVLARAEPSGRDLTSDIRRAAMESASGLPYIDVRPLDATFERMLRPWRLGSTIFVAFGLVALVISTLGLIFLTGVVVVGRQRELAIRTAVGATPRRLITLVLQQHLAAVVGGLLVGLGLAWMGGRWLESLLYGVAANDPRLFAAVAALLLVVALLASYLPARRAGRIDPVAALRTE